VRYTVDQTFRCESVERFAEVYFSDDFNNAVAAEIGLKERRLVELEELGDGRVRRRVRMIPSVELPKALRKLIGDAVITYDEVSTYDPARQETSYWVDSAVKDRVQVSGTIRFIAAEGGVRRVIDSEVKARVFGLGRVIESLVKNEVQKGYVVIGRFMQDYLDRASV
jgi:hypothetical protein